MQSTVAAATALAMMATHAHAFIAPPSFAEFAERRAIIDQLRSDDLEGVRDQLDAWLAANPTDGVMFYNAACVEARVGNVERAQDRLLDAIRQGFDRFSHMRRDPDLAALHDAPVYRAIVTARRAAAPLLLERRLRYWQERFDIPRSRVVESNRFTFLRGDGGLTSQALASDCGRFVDLIEGLVFGPVWADCVLVVLPGPTRDDELFVDGHAHGLYQHDDRTIVVRDDAAALRHELVHAAHEMHMDELGQQHPIWIREGLASLFEAITANDGSLQIVANDRDLIVDDLLAAGRLRRWQYLMLATDSSFNRSRAEHYATVRSILEFLWQADLLQLWYSTYVERFQDDPTGRLALELVFDRDIEDIELEWVDWLVQRSIQLELSEPWGSWVETEEPAITEASRELFAQQDLARDVYQDIRPRVLDDYADAIAGLQDVLNLDPHHASARYDLGLAHVYVGNMDAARVQHAALATLDENLANLLNALIEK